MAMDESNRVLTTRTGFRFHVRPARPDDEAGLAEFFRHVTPEDLRFRFLSTIREVSHDRLVAMTQIDHRQTESFVALADDGKSIIATAMLACDAALQKGEVAISIRREDKHRGVGWELLGHICRFAEAKGVKVVESLESRQNREAIDIEREQGFEMGDHPEDPNLVILRKTIGKT